MASSVAVLDKANTPVESRRFNGCREAAFPGVGAEATIFPDLTFVTSARAKIS